MIENIEILKNNCKEYARPRKSVDVLRNANGRNHYTEIAKIVGLHATKVSTLLKRAEKLGLAKKIKKGIYKKNPGILGYMPSKNEIKSSSSETMSNIIQRITKNKKVKSMPSSSFSFAIPYKIGADISKIAKAYSTLYCRKYFKRIS